MSTISISSSYEDKESRGRQRELYERLQTGPAFLFLGQNHLRLETGTDPFLAEVLRKYNEHDKGVDDHYYSRIFEGAAKEFPETSLAWMQERCRRFSAPEGLQVIAQFPWSGVYTSAIDTILPTAFGTEWRELQPIFEEKFSPANPRNRSNLHCTYLFGRVDRDEYDERPPLSRVEWIKRKQVAVALARRLPELVTPLGVMVIEGYAGEKDWLPPEDLFPILDKLKPGQTHLYSVTDELARNEFINELVRQGKLILHSEGLAHYLLRASEAGFISLDQPLEDQGYGRRIRIAKRSISIPTQIWNQVSRSATILDESLLAEQTPDSQERRYRAFRRFLAESGVRPVWSGYQSGFAFKRVFEEHLRKEVNGRLKDNELHNEPIIVFGQSGTGKVVA
jgi:hypothetical protein